MNLKQIGIVLLFLDFVALTVYAIAMEPPGLFLTAITSSWWVAQVCVDLCIALTFGGVWVWRDAKERGINPLPWVLAIPLCGSLALLAYAIRRGHAPRPALASPATA